MIRPSDQLVQLYIRHLTYDSIRVVCESAQFLAFGREIWARAEEHRGGRVTGIE